MRKKQTLDILSSASNFLHDTLTSIFKIEISESVAQAVEAVIKCKGAIITTGMGKAGHVARKCASTLCSLTFKSSYVHPGEASHGDIGIVSPGDIVIAFSNSGKTREVIETIEFARQLGANKIISVTSHPDSPIRKISDIVLDMGEISEAGHLSIAPTTSIVVMLIISDMIALVAAEMKGITKSDYGLRHHGGYLGQKCRGEAR